MGTMGVARPPLLSVAYLELPTCGRIAICQKQRQRTHSPDHSLLPSQMPHLELALPSMPPTRSGTLQALYSMLRRHGQEGCDSERAGPIADLASMLINSNKLLC